MQTKRLFCLIAALAAACGDDTKVAKDGRAEHSFDVQGWSYQFFAIR